MKPIAIVGIGCRFPGGVFTPTHLWELLTAARDVVTEIPSDRRELVSAYEAESGAALRFGGFIEGIWGFDAAFFGIAPREAAAMDPQHRLLLQATWEALEDAGIRPSRIAGSTIGVFAGLHLDDYARRVQSVGLDLIGATATSRNGAAGRIAYLFDLLGPAMVVDTDRSSGLVALHNACAAIWSEECESAIVGAANLILTPDLSIAFSSAGLLSVDGRSKFADASANGFVRSEGVAAVVLRPLEIALRDDNPIYGVIRGSAVQAAGKASGDLMTPSADAQARLITQACGRAEISPTELAYVEAHGTGTPIGDTVELLALERVLGGASRASPCLVGSIKSNIGHCEATAGLAGLIKVALMARYGAIPASLHFREFSPDLAGRELGIRIPTALHPVPPTTEFVAGVSSFGLTGINAHVVVARHAPPSPPPSAAPSPSRCAVLPLSARDRKGLHRLAGDLATLVRDPATDLEAVCHSAAVRRDPLIERAAFVGPSREDLATALESFATADTTESAFIVGTAPMKTPSKVVFVFPGQGGQWAGMGRQLLSQNRAFAESMERSDAIVRDIAGWSLIDEIRGEPRLDRIDVVQPLLVAFEVALSELWTSWGVRPSAVVGTSMGEVAAAHVSGALSRVDTFRIVCERSRLMRTLVGSGAMAVIDLPAREIPPLGDHVSIAAANGPSSTVISGERSAVEALVREFERAKVFAQLIRVDVASHSAQVDPILKRLTETLQTISPTEATIPFYSTVRRGRIPGQALTAAYWADNLRMPVELSDVVQLLLAEEHDVFIEIGPHPVLRSPLLEGVAHAHSNASVLGTLKRDDDEVEGALASLARLYVSGFPVDWTRILRERPFQQLPFTPWRSSVYRIEPPTERRAPRERPASTPPAASGATAPPSFIQRLEAVPTQARIAMMRTTLRVELGQILGMPTDAIDLARTFRDLGLTSLAGTEFRSAIGRLLGRVYPSSLLFNYPDLDTLATHLTEEFAPSFDGRGNVTQPTSAREEAVEPLAIVGMALRFPGGIDSKEQLWQLLRDGRDTITEVPSDRWDASSLYDPNPLAAGKLYTRWGSFVEEIGHFDHGFFRISPREAATMDPQQRLLLELSRHAFENAGMPRSRLMGTDTGVFIGMMNTNEYASRRNVDSSLEEIGPFTSTADAMSIAAGRISYFFGLRGPALTVDTACSSSLVALHLAGASLRARECSAALVAGVNLIASPSTTMSFAKARLLSPTGRCRTFDAAADGYVRAEGGCVIVLKRLSEALADGDNVLAIVRGSAINQDGRSNGLTAPNGLAQQAVITRALNLSGVAPATVSYVEAHGTGTRMGDPIEVQSLTDVFRGTRDPTNRLYLGAVKANLGHLEACAGLAGVAKVIGSMEHREIPPQTGVERVNPSIVLPDWLIIPRERHEWAPVAGRWVAGVSAFGFSGTNAHVILETPTEVVGAVPAEVADPEPRVIAVSSASPGDLPHLARRFVEALALPLSRADVGELAYSSTCRREHLACRAAFVASEPADVLARLRAIAEGSQADGLYLSRDEHEPPVVGFMYTGEVPDDRAPLAALYTSEPAFRAAFDECHAWLTANHGLPIVELLFEKRATSHAVGRTMTLAVQYALTRLWATWQVVPTCVVGHGFGEYAAGLAAGIRDLESTLSSVYRRGRLVDGLGDPGLLARLHCAAERFEELSAHARTVGDVSIAAYDTPTELMVGGRTPAMERVLRSAAAHGIRADVLPGLPGLHSPVMDQMDLGLEEGANGLAMARPRITYVSAMTGGIVTDEPATAPYWNRVLREPVRFVDAIRSLKQAGCNVFVEIGAGQSLLRTAREVVREDACLWIPSTSTERPARAHTRDALARLFAAGVNVEWTSLYGEHTPKFRPLPPTPFSRRRFWASDRPVVS